MINVLYEGGCNSSKWSHFISLLLLPLGIYCKWKVAQCEVYLNRIWILLFEVNETWKPAFKKKKVLWFWINNFITICMQHMYVLVLLTFPHSQLSRTGCLIGFFDLCLQHVYHLQLLLNMSQLISVFQEHPHGFHDLQRECCLNLGTRLSQHCWKLENSFAACKTIAVHLQGLVFLHWGGKPAIMGSRWIHKPLKSNGSKKRESLASDYAVVLSGSPWLVITQLFCQGRVRTDCWGITLNSKMSICRRGTDKLPTAPSWQIKGKMDCNFLLRRTEDGKVKSCLCRGMTGKSDVDKAIYVLIFIVLYLLHLKQLLLLRTQY